ncbi:MAG: DUF365 domain-containing protein [Nitrososphaeria archaeon]
MENKDVGIVFPVRPEHVHRIFDEKKNVFVKYFSRAPKKLEDFRLKEGMKIIFYVSCSKRKLAGEAEIKNITFLTPNEVIEKYRERLFISEKELLKYVHRQPRRQHDKPLLVLELENMRRYPEGITYHKNISMVGEYITKEVYKKFQQEYSTRE